MSVKKILIDERYFQDNIKVHIFFNTRKYLDDIREILSPSTNSFYYPTEDAAHDKYEKTETKHEIVEYLDNYGVCNGVDRYYVLSQIRNNDVVIVMKDISNENRLVAFATFQIISYARKIKIMVLCSNIEEYKNGGTFLMDNISDLAEDLHVRSIELDSVPNSVGFYMKKGFECRSHEGLCPMVRKIKAKTRQTAKVSLSPNPAKENPTKEKTKSITSVNKKSKRNTSKKIKTAPTTFSAEEIKDFISDCNNEHGNITSFMKRGIDVNMKDENGESVLLLAVSSGNIMAIELLLQNGANINETNEDGLSLLMVAVKNLLIDKKYRKIIDILLDVHPNISVKDKNGNDIFYHIEIEKFEAEEEENQSVLKYLTNLDQRLKRLI